MQCILVQENMYYFVWKVGSGKPNKISNVVLSLVKITNSSWWRNNSISTSVRNKLLELRSSDILGWTFRGLASCQLSIDTNKIKRLEWPRKSLSTDFNDVVWTDEASILLETHRRFSYRKKGEQPTLKPWAKHPIKVHMRARIKKIGATKRDF